ncbi:MAG: ribonuclease HII, partial [Microthrixaceae bacterium]|nr:ribonuclease HII [Microthrixaceae bacterium]
MRPVPTAVGSPQRASTRRARTPKRGRAPSLSFERAWWDRGAACVVGIDEVGRGSWAGPLTVGVAVLPTDRRVNGVRDSKMLTEARREALFDRVAEWCRGWAVGHAWPHECDELGMSAAQRLAAARALDSLGLPVDAVLMDGKWDFVGHDNTTMIVKGDAKCL